MEIDKEATTRVMKARAALILQRRFYGVLVSHVEPVCSRRFPTMATNGKQHYFNPDFIMSLTQAEVEGVQAHESEHDARHHGTRRSNRDPDKWNIACDLAINGDLLAEGFVLPKCRLFEQRFVGMSAEDIYRIRELEEQKAKEEQQQQSPPPPQEGDDESESDEPEANQIGDDDQEPGDDDGNGDDKAEADDNAEGDQPGNEDSQGDGDQDDTSDEGEGEAGNGNDGESSDKKGEGDVGSGSGEGDGEGEAQSCGDPGQCGEVLDSAEDASENAEIDQKWERVVRQAASMARSIGQLPGHVTAEIERANSPPRDWREELRAWVDNGTRRIETWNRPNRRVISQGLILPSSQREGVNKIACVVDTSGSMDDIALGCIRNELQAMLDEHAIDELVAIYCDTRVTRVDSFVQGDELIFDPRGRGGTDLIPAFKHVADEVGEVSGILVFTDLFIGEPGPEPDCNVMFCVYGYPQQVSELIKNSPWGAPAIDVGVH